MEFTHTQPPSPPGLAPRRPNTAASFFLYRHRPLASSSSEAPVGLEAPPPPLSPNSALISASSSAVGIGDWTSIHLSPIYLGPWNWIHFQIKGSIGLNSNCYSWTDFWLNYLPLFNKRMLESINVAADILSWLNWWKGERRFNGGFTGKEFWIFGSQHWWTEVLTSSSWWCSTYLINFFPFLYTKIAVSDMMFGPCRCGSCSSCSRTVPAGYRVLGTGSCHSHQGEDKVIEFSFFLYRNCFNFASSIFYVLSFLIRTSLNRQHMLMSVMILPMHSEQDPSTVKQLKQMFQL